MSMMKLRSKDGIVLNIDLEVARTCGTLRQMLDNLGVEDGQDNVDEVVPIPHFNALTLRKVIEWINHHKDDQEDVGRAFQKSGRLARIGAWDAEFLKVDQTLLFDIINAAHYLDVSRLAEIASTHVVNMIDGDSPETIRRKFNIPNDLSQEELQAIKRDEKKLGLIPNYYCDEDSDFEEFMPLKL